MSIKLSVTVPMLQAKYIGWIVLESLARQKDIDFDWELLVAEECDYDPMGWEAISPYRQKLRNVRCINVNYTSLAEWIPLGSKVTQLAHSCDGNSTIWMNVDVDQYLPPRYLKRAYDALTNSDVDCYRTPKWILYRINPEAVHLYDVTSKPHRHDQPVATVHIDIARKIDITGKVDCGPKILDGIPRIKKRPTIIYNDESDNWKYGINVTGFNSCTTARPFSGSHAPYFPYKVPIEEIVPKDILQRLRDSKQHIKKIHGCGLHTTLYKEWHKKNTV